MVLNEANGLCASTRPLTPSGHQQLNLKKHVSETLHLPRWSGRTGKRATLSSLAVTQPKKGLRATRVQGRTQWLFNLGRRVPVYLPTSSDRVRPAPYQRVPQPKNMPVTALPITADVCGHRKSSICQRELWKTWLLKHHRKSSNKIESAS